MTTKPYKRGDYIDSDDFQYAVIAALASLGFKACFEVEKLTAFVGSGTPHTYEKWVFKLVDQTKGNQS